MKVGDIIPIYLLRLGYVYSFGSHGAIFKAIRIQGDEIYIEYIDGTLDFIHFYDTIPLKVIKVPTELQKALL